MSTLSRLCVFWSYKCLEAFYSVPLQSYWVRLFASNKGRKKPPAFIQRIAVCSSPLQLLEWLFFRLSLLLRTSCAITGAKTHRFLIDVRSLACTLTLKLFRTYWNVRCERRLGIDIDNGQRTGPWAAKPQAKSLPCIFMSVKKENRRLRKAKVSMAGSPPQQKDKRGSRR